MKSHGLLHRSLYALAGLIAVGICAAAVALLWLDRRASWTQAYVSASNLTEVLAADIGRTIHVYDLSLQGVIERLQEPGIRDLPRATLHRFLFDRSASAEFLGTILILDSEGNVVYDSQSIEPAKANFADRDFFQVHRDSADAGMYVSQPYRSRLRDGDESIGISRRLSNADGSFAGVVTGSLRLAFFRERFARLSLGPQDSITILRNDGAVIARSPYSSTDLGADIGQAKAFQQFLIRRDGAFVGALAPDGVERLYTFDTVPGAPLIVDVALAVDQVLQRWERRAMLIIPITLALFASVMAQIVLYRRETRLRQEVESQLERQAQTDGLTGIANRRTFDETLQREWQSAIREGQPLSLLFLDADHFKLYNDRYGHQEGDELLKILALTVRGKARRPRDLVARYGGEEFVALLPDTAQDRAVEIAERIRQAVVGLHAPHEDNEGGIVTVSIGVATCIPKPADDASILVETADAAVYRAKETGRNRVTVAAA